MSWSWSRCYASDLPVAVASWHPSRAAETLVTSARQDGRTEHHLEISATGAMGTRAGAKCPIDACLVSKWKALLHEQGIPSMNRTAHRDEALREPRGQGAESRSSGRCCVSAGPG